MQNVRIVYHDGTSRIYIYQRRMKYTYLSVPLLLALAVPALASAAPCPASWDRTLKVGSTGDDVHLLQQFLNTDADTRISLSGAGSLGFETSTFGGLTKVAVVKFQEKYAADILVPNGLSKGSGIVGASTRAKLNALCSSAAANAAAATATGPSSQSAGLDALTVSADEQPASSLAPTYAGVHFLTFTLSAGVRDVIVQDLTVERTGLSSDAPLDSIALYDEEGLQVGSVVRLDANHRATFRKSFTIPAGTSKTYDIYVNMADATGHDGEMPALQLASITATSPVIGALPVRGMAQTVNSTITVGGAHGYISMFDPLQDTTHYINEKGVRFSGIRISADAAEDLEFAYLIWTQAGTAGTSDIENVATVIDGTSYPAVISPYSQREYISFFEPAIVIQKGRSIEAYIQGDLKVQGANRTVRFDIYDTTDDIGFTGLNYGLGVGIVPGGNTATEGGSVFLTDDGTTAGTGLNPFFQGSVTTISNGAIISVSR